MKLSTALVCGLVAALSLTTSAFVGAALPGHFPRVHDEFAYLLAGQTFAHFQLTNPTPLWRFFESHHVLLVPTMMAKYPPGPGLALAVGYWLGAPIYGVWLSGAAKNRLLLAHYPDRQPLLMRVSDDRVEFSPLPPTVAAPGRTTPPSH